MASKSVTAVVQGAGGAVLSIREYTPHSRACVVRGAGVAHVGGAAPQAVQSGALIPATARAATGVFRDSPPGSRPKKSSGASAVRFTCTAWAEPQSADWPAPEVASAAVAKQVGVSIVLVRLPAAPPICRVPKLYAYAGPPAACHAFWTLAPGAGGPSSWEAACSAVP